jgi:hypothetical protein
MVQNEPWQIRDRAMIDKLRKKSKMNIHHTISLVLAISDERE